MRGRLAVGVVALVLTLIGLVLGVLASVRGELSPMETICGAAIVALVLAVCVIGIGARARLLRRQQVGRETSSASSGP